MKLSKTSGVTIAAAAAALLIGGAMAPAAQAQTAAKVQCYGVNGCKGQGSCKTATNECKAQNGCKGKGFLEMTAKECMEKGGKTKQS